MFLYILFKLEKITFLNTVSILPKQIMHASVHAYSCCVKWTFFHNLNYVYLYVLVFPNFWRIGIF